MNKIDEVFLNKNNIYDQSNIDKIISDFNKKSYLYGELDHPDKFDVNLSKVSHKINDIFVQNGTLMADIDVLKTPNGDVLKTLIDNDMFHFSARYSGTIGDDGKVEIKNFYKFLDPTKKHTLVLPPS